MSQGHFLLGLDCPFAGDSPPLETLEDSAPAEPDRWRSLPFGFPLIIFLLPSLASPPSLELSRGAPVISKIH